MLVNEAVTLQECNVGLKNDVITLQRRRRNQIRVIPIGPDVHKVLAMYLDSPLRRQFRGGRFFLTRAGRPVQGPTLIFNFRELRRRASVVRLDRAWYQPRMHDLRSTFAVHRLAAWYKEGLDPRRLLPSLGAYMGYSGFASMIRHLALMPEHYRWRSLIEGATESSRG